MSTNYPYTVTYRDAGRGEPHTVEFSSREAAEEYAAETRDMLTRLGAGYLVDAVIVSEIDFYPRAYISRIPVNMDYAPGDISNVYIFVAPFSIKSAKRMTEHGRFIVRTLVAIGYWPGKTWEDMQNLPSEQFRALAERHTHPYNNVERMDTTKYGADTTFQHDRGSFGTDTRKVFARTNEGI